METLADRVRWILKRTGWSQRELARKATLPSPSHISLLLNNLGDGVTAKTLEKIAAAAGVSYEWLASGRGSPDVTAAARRTKGNDHLDDLPNWPALLVGARAAAPDVAEWAWTQLAGDNVMQTVEMNVAAVVKLGRMVMELGSPPAGAGVEEQPKPATPKPTKKGTKR